MEEHIISIEKLESAFKSLKADSSPGFDEIRPSIVKQVFNVISLPILHIFNTSLNKGISPDKLKTARVTPVFKSGNKEDCTNYRPISVLPCFSKLLERIIYNRLYAHLLSNNILYNKQFGFQKNFSTEHAVLQLTNQLHQSFSQNKFTIGVFLDLSKAFDTVNYSILLSKLSHYGIKKNTLLV